MVIAPMSAGSAHLEAATIPIVGESGANARQSGGRYFLKPDVSSSFTSHHRQRGA
jgi:hypothetical protein